MSLGSEQKKQPQGLRESLAAVLQRLKGGELTERRLGLSVALGLFIGCSPLFGFHAAIALGLALVLRLDVLIAYLATTISVPPLLPFLLFAELQVGSFLMTGRFHALSLRDFAPEKALELGAAVFVGFPVIGTAIAVLGGTLAYVIGARVLTTESVTSLESSDSEE
jgi:uncharacterized protein (DUF2062 family)